VSETPIQWTDRSWGYQQGCSPKSPGCSRCYAEKIAKRLAKNPKVPQYTEAIARWNGILNFHVRGLIEPLLRKEGASWFPSMTDPFHETALDEWIGLPFLVAAVCPQHRFLMLTKRPERILDWLKSDVAQELQEAIDPPAAFHLQLLSLLEVCGLEDEWEIISEAIGMRDRSNAHTQFPLPNVLFGASVEDQVRANERMPIMHEIKRQGWHTFVSAEPLLEEIDLHLDQYPVDWVIIGGESGDNARPFNLNSGRSLIRQCRDNEVKAFFKQTGTNVVDSAPYIAGTQVEATHWQVKFKDKKGGEPTEWEEQLRVREVPEILQLRR